MGKKTRKGITAKEPPVPTDTHAEIEDWLTRLVMPEMQPIVKRLDGSIRETIPGLQYAIKWKQAYYGLPDLGWIIEIAPYTVSVNVSFLGGADFDPPPPLGTTESEPLRQADDAGGGAGTGDARMDSNKPGACRVGDDLSCRKAARVGRICKHQRFRMRWLRPRRPLHRLT